jgi:hypothetical protein
MINYPIIQQKVRDELEEICGDSLPSLAHQPRHLNYKIKIPVLLTKYLIKSNKDCPILKLF